MDIAVFLLILGAMICGVVAWSEHCRRKEAEEELMYNLAVQACWAEILDATGKDDPEAAQAAVDILLVEHDWDIRKVLDGLEVWY